jgi:hypothetical protein
VTDTRVVTGADKLKRRLQLIATTLALAPMTDFIGEMILVRNLERFDREEDPDGRKWERLSDRTKADKFGVGAANKKILVRSGAMRGAIQLIKGNVAGSTFVNTGAGVRIGVKGQPRVVARARAHNRGVPKMGLPQRRFLGVADSDVRAVDLFLKRLGNKALG